MTWELHQCPFCYDMVSEEHEEFCPLNPLRVPFERPSIASLVDDPRIPEEIRAETNPLHGGVCVWCERPAPVLTANGYCESCVLEDMIDNA